MIIWHKVTKEDDMQCRDQHTAVIVLSTLQNFGACSCLYSFCADIVLQGLVTQCGEKYEYQQTINSVPFAVAKKHVLTLIAMGMPANSPKELVPS